MNLNPATWGLIARRRPSTALTPRFDLDRLPRPAVAILVDARDHNLESSLHRHRKGQLVLVLRGSVTCKVPDGIWIVPPDSGVWIPSGMPHSNRIAANGRVCFLFVQPNMALLPDQCRTLSLTPLVRELIQHLAGLPQLYSPKGPTARLVKVLLEELVRMPMEQLHLPISAEPRLRRIADMLIADPSDRSTLSQWASWVAMSERSFARLILKESGMTFSRWRQQLHIIVALQCLYSGASVQAVSQDMGYQSVSAFITMFKKSLGKSPGRYLAAKKSTSAERQSTNS